MYRISKAMTQQAFEKTFHVGWADVDMNGHLANTAYINLAVDVRLFFFEENGFSVMEFHRQGFGPVMRRDEIEYYRECRLLDNVRITLKLAGISRDGSRFKIRQDFYHFDDTLAATLYSTGGWLSARERKLIAPPREITEMWDTLARTEDFEEMPSSIRK